MGKFIQFLLSLLFIFSSAQIFAEEVDTTKTLENEKLSVMQGSASPWSLQFNLSYLGSSLDTPFSEYAPNPQNDAVPPRVTMSGTFSARRRISDKISAGLGSGLQVDTPFHHPQNLTVSNPTLDLSWSAWDLYWISSLMFYTDPIWKNYGYSQTFTQSVYGLFWTQDPWSLGAQAGYNYNFFSKPNDYQLLESLGLYPFLEYRIRKGVVFRHSFSINQMHFANSSQWVESPLTASTSIGFAIHRIIYFSPYLFYSINDISKLKTKEISIGISCNFNLF